MWGKVNKLEYVIHYLVCGKSMKEKDEGHLLDSLLQVEFNSMGHHHRCRWSLHLRAEHVPRSHRAYSQILNVTRLSSAAISLLSTFWIQIFADKMCIKWEEHMAYIKLEKLYYPEWCVVKGTTRGQYCTTESICRLFVFIFINADKG